MLPETLDPTEHVNKVQTAYLKQIFANMNMHGKIVRFQVNSGATCNVLPMKYLTGLNYQIKPTDQTLVFFNKTEAKPKGSCQI